MIDTGDIARPSSRRAPEAPEVRGVYDAGCRSQRQPAQRHRAQRQPGDQRHLRVVARGQPSGAFGAVAISATVAGSLYPSRRRPAVDVLHQRRR
ncbi:hypothetical protein ACU686_18405 [Yinghuangia aomiensis]